MAPVILLQIGQSFVDPRQRNQHSRQHVCQHPMDTVGSVYGSRQIRHKSDVDDDTRDDSCCFGSEDKSKIFKLSTNQKLDLAFKSCD